MPLIHCYECEKEISDKAVSCPNCGAPRPVAIPPMPQPSASSTTTPSSEPVETAVEVISNIVGFRAIAFLLFIVSAATDKDFIWSVGIAWFIGSIIIIIIAGQFSGWWRKIAGISRQDTETSLTVVEGKPVTSTSNDDIPWIGKPGAAAMVIFGVIMAIKNMILSNMGSFLFFGVIAAIGVTLLISGSKKK